MSWTPPTGQAPGEDRYAVKWTGWDILMVFFAALGFGSLAMGVLFLVFEALEIDFSSTVTFGIAGVGIYAAVLISGWLLILKRRGATPTEVGLKWVGIGPLLLAIPVTFVLMAVTWVILEVIQQLIGGVPSGEEQLGLEGSSLGRSELVWLLLVVAVAAPIAEEFFFRGLLYRYMRRSWNVKTATLVSAAVFAVFHLTPLLMPALFVLGVALALLVERYDSLYPPMLLHTLNNGLVIVGIYVTID